MTRGRDMTWGRDVTRGMIRAMAGLSSSVSRSRVVAPLVTLRLFLLRIPHGNITSNHPRQLTGLCLSIRIAVLWF